MKSLKGFTAVLLVLLISGWERAAAQTTPQLPITVAKEKKTILLQGEDDATKKDPAVAEYMNLVAGEIKEIYNTQELKCTWTLYLKLVPREKFKLIEITIEDKENSSTANRIIKTGLPPEKEEYAEQAKSAAKRITQLLTCTPKS